MQQAASGALSSGTVKKKCHAFNARFAGAGARFARRGDGSRVNQRALSGVSLTHSLVSRKVSPMHDHCSAWALRLPARCESGAVGR
jgi:hypothetical protein